MSSDASSRQVFRVTIFNQTLSIASSTSPDEFHRIAAQIDQLMAMIASKSGTADGARVGVLTAMHLADRLHQMERKAEAKAAESRQDAAEAEAASARVIELEAQQEAMRASLDQASAELQQLRSELEDAARQKASLQAELGSARGNTAALQAEFANLQRIFKETQAALETERARIGRNADRLHSLLEEALEPSDSSMVRGQWQSAASGFRVAEAATPDTPSDTPRAGNLFAFDEPGSSRGAGA